MYCDNLTYQNLYAFRSRACLRRQACLPKSSKQMTIIRMPRGADREYLAAYGIFAVYVASSRKGPPAIVGVSRDLIQTLTALRRRRHMPLLHMTCIYWIEDPAEARLLVREVNAGLPQLEMDGAAAQRKIENVAAHIGILLNEHHTVLTRAHAAVEFVERHIENAQANGQLRWFNRAFRHWRLEAKKHGRSMSYAEARARLRKKMFRQVLSAPTKPGLFPALPSLEGRLCVNSKGPLFTLAAKSKTHE